MPGGPPASSMSTASAWACSEVGGASGTTRKRVVPGAVVAAASFCAPLTCSAPSIPWMRPGSPDPLVCSACSRGVADVASPTPFQNAAAPAADSMPGKVTMLVTRSTPGSASSS